MNKKTKTVKMKNYVCVRDHLKLEQNSLGRKEKKQNRKFTIAYCDKPKGREPPDY